MTIVMSIAVCARDRHPLGPKRRGKARRRRDGARYGVAGSARLGSSRILYQFCTKTLLVRLLTRSHVSGPLIRSDGSGGPAARHHSRNRLPSHCCELLRISGTSARIPRLDQGRTTGASGTLTSVGRWPPSRMVIASATAVLIACSRVSTTMNPPPFSRSGRTDQGRPIFVGVAMHHLTPAAPRHTRTKVLRVYPCPHRPLRSTRPQPA